MKTITFVSHYNNLEKNVRLSDEKAEKLMNNKWYSPLELFNLDADRVAAGEAPRYFSKGQIKALVGFFSGIDYWEDIIEK